MALMTQKGFKISILSVFFLYALLSLFVPGMPDKVYAAVPTPSYLITFNGDFLDHSSNDKDTLPGATATIINDAERGKVLQLRGAVTGSGAQVRVINTLPSSYTKAAWVKFQASAGGLYSILSDGGTATLNSDTFTVASINGGSSVL